MRVFLLVCAVACGFGELFIVGLLRGAVADVAGYDTVVTSGGQLTMDQWNMMRGALFASGALTAALVFNIMLLIGALWLRTRYAKKP